MSGRYEIGERVTIIAAGRVVDISDAHGLCYEVELDPGDFRERYVWVDPSELERRQLDLTPDQLAIIDQALTMWSNGRDGYAEVADRIRAKLAKETP